MVLNIHFISVYKKNFKDLRFSLKDWRFVIIVRCEIKYLYLWLKSISREIWDLNARFDVRFAHYWKTAEVCKIVTLMPQPISVLILSRACICANRSDGSSCFLLRSKRQPIPPVKSTSASSVTPPIRASYEPNNLAQSSQDHYQHCHRLSTAVRLSQGELGPVYRGSWSHLTQCSLGQVLLPYQVAFSSIQPFGHNRHELRGCAPFMGGEPATPSNTTLLPPRFTSLPSGILIHAAISPQ